MVEPRKGRTIRNGYDVVNYYADKAEAAESENAALHQEIERLRGEPNLGLATTQQLLDELTVRIEVDYYSGGGGLDYTTARGRPDGQDHAALAPESDHG